MLVSAPARAPAPAAVPAPSAHVPLLAPALASAGDVAALVEKINASNDLAFLCTIGRQLVNHAEVAQSMAKRLANLANEGDDDLKGKIVEFCGLDAIVKGMRTHVGVADVLRFE